MSLSLLSVSLLVAGVCAVPLAYSALIDTFQLRILDVIGHNHISRCNSDPIIIQSIALRHLDNLKPFSLMKWWGNSWDLCLA